MENIDMRGATLDDIRHFMQGIGEKPFRAEQVFSWIHAKFANSYDEMTNLPVALRKRLAEIAPIAPIELIRTQKSADGATRKCLLKLYNSGIMDVYVETVLMTYRHGTSVCVSTQAGCRMGCDFCASGLTGLQRNLTAGEIAAQYYVLCREINSRIGNIVVMGSGEPLDNYDNTLGFIQLIGHPKGANIGLRHITVSTCGIVPKIYDLAKENLPITLAVSLNAPNDQIRRRLMPIARKYDYDALIAACRAYAEKSRRISFEYIMIDGVNDSEGNAKELAKRLDGINCHINLIAANKVPEKGYNRSNATTIMAFANILEKSGHRVTIRKEMGSDISAACGQLRNELRNDHSLS
ncbi:MAG: 23S rRNA (adenine(2503)-C(2))-methyltransferase RlmN [Clostridiales bacterium]|jgi:23S rRNA (adenine2503-C2)-methyltransferase|nr:23S rRNA (adenine(2503)-C(2))-methyltransferase RlmN [Clostridiales bacterium]